MPKSKMKKRRDKLELAKQHYRQIILPTFLEENEPPFSDITFDAIVVTLNVKLRELTLLARKAMVDLDGCNLKTKITPTISVNSRKQYNLLYTTIQRERIELSRWEYITVRQTSSYLCYNDN